MRHPEYTYLEGDDLIAFHQQPVDGKCASCIYWEYWDMPTWVSDKMQKVSVSLGLPLTANVDYTGWCKRRSPIADENDEDQQAIWPSTEWNDWCGDHQHRAVEAEPKPTELNDGGTAERTD